MMSLVFRVPAVPSGPQPPSMVPFWAAALALAALVVWVVVQR